MIDKFQIPLALSASGEDVRKMIKKIGQEMLDDPEWGPLFIEPLKGKLYRIDPGVKVFRCKFQTLPGRQFEVRTAALHRIEATLAAAGIELADTAARVNVELGDPATAPAARAA